MQHGGLEMGDLQKDGEKKGRGEGERDTKTVRKTEHGNHPRGTMERREMVVGVEEVGDCSCLSLCPRFDICVHRVNARARVELQ